MYLNIRQGACIAGRHGYFRVLGDLLKTSRASQLFTVLGSPEAKVQRSAGLQPGKAAALKLE